MSEGPGCLADLVIGQRLLASYQTAQLVLSLVGSGMNETSHTNALQPFFIHNILWNTSLCTALVQYQTHRGHSQSSKASKGSVGLKYLAKVAEVYRAGEPSGLTFQ